MKSRFPFLDGIRGLAAIFVLTRHTGDYWTFGFFRSYLAVDLFFILSGFVIAHAYDQRLAEKQISTNQFMLVRLIRLYPVFLISLIVAAPLFIFNAYTGQHADYDSLGPVIASVVLAALFIPYCLADNGTLFAVNAPYWSLFFELLANFLYAALRPFLTNRLLAVIVSGAGLGVMITALEHGDLDIGFTWHVTSFIGGTARTVFGIFTGLLLYRYKSMQPARASTTWMPWAVTLLVCAILMSPHAGKLNPWIDMLSVCLVFPAAVFIAASGKCTTTMAQAMVTLGAASYPLYVLHKPVGDIVHWFLGDSIRAIAPFSGLLFVAILIPLAAVLENKLDVPIRKYLTQKMFDGGRPVYQHARRSA